MAARIQPEARRGLPKGYGFRTSEEGKRMRCIRGAKAAHVTMRKKGRVPGDEGRAAIMRSRKLRKLIWNCENSQCVSQINNLEGI